MRPACPLLLSIGLLLVGASAGTVGAQPSAAPVVPAGAASGATDPSVELVRFGTGDLDVDRRFDFAIGLLRLALQRSGGRYEVRVAEGMNLPRSKAALAAGQIDVLMAPDTDARACGRGLVAIPLRRGLLGVRLLVTRRGEAQRLMHVGSLQELKRDFALGHGATWADTQPLQDLGFNIVTASTYEGLFEMLRGGRFDYVSRGVNEFAQELEHPVLGRELEVVPGIALFYPLDDYFCVARGRPRLREAIERGFRRALEDGSYDALFESYYRPMMDAAGISERSVLHVVGFPVPPGTPLAMFDVLQPVRSEGRLRSPQSPEGVETEDAPAAR